MCVPRVSAEWKKIYLFIVFHCMRMRDQDRKRETESVCVCVCEHVHLRVCVQWVCVSIIARDQRRVGREPHLNSHPI